MAHDPHLVVRRTCGKAKQREYAVKHRLYDHARSHTQDHARRYPRCNAYPLALHYTRISANTHSYGHPTDE